MVQQQKERGKVMARFNLDDYETVESRIKRFYEAFEDGRIVTDWANEFAEQPEKARWVVKATIYLSAGDQANKLIKSTGYASETEGTGGANNVDALANCETSAIGRALANMAMSGNKRASREEMQKVESVAQHATLDWMAKLDEMDTKAEVRGLYAEALRNQAPKQVLDAITAKGKTAK
jgi:hypothetical protein